MGEIGKAGGVSRYKKVGRQEGVGSSKRKVKQGEVSKARKSGEEDTVLKAQSQALEGRLAEVKSKRGELKKELREFGVLEGKFKEKSVNLSEEMRLFVESINIALDAGEIEKIGDLYQGYVDINERMEKLHDIAREAAELGLGDLLESCSEGVKEEVEILERTHGKLMDLMLEIFPKEKPIAGERRKLEHSYPGYGELNTRLSEINKRLGRGREELVTRDRALKVDVINISPQMLGDPLFYKEVREFGVKNGLRIRLNLGDPVSSEDVDKFLRVLRGENGGEFLKQVGSLSIGTMTGENSAKVQELIAFLAAKTPNKISLGWEGVEKGGSLILPENPRMVVFHAGKIDVGAFYRGHDVDELNYYTDAPNLQDLAEFAQLRRQVTLNFLARLRRERKDQDA